MLSSLCCFAIIALIDDPQGPPPATPAAVILGPTASERKTLPGLADTGPETQSDHPKHPLQVGTDFDLKSQGLKRCRDGRTDIGAISSD